MTAQMVAELARRFSLCPCIKPDRGDTGSCVEISVSTRPYDAKHGLAFLSHIDQRLDGEVWYSVAGHQSGWVITVEWDGERYYR